MAESTRSPKYAFIKLNIANRALILLVDSGSDVSLLSKDNYNLIENHLNNQLNTSKITYIEGLGGPTEPLGEVKVNFELSNITLSINFIIVQSLPVADGIIGRDFLTYYEAKLNYATGSLNVCGNEIPLLPGSRNSFCVSIDRVDKIFKSLSKAFDNVPPEAKAPLKNLIIEYLDIFRLEGERIPPVNFYKQNINLSDRKPVYIPQYRIPHTHRIEMKRQVLEMLDLGIIRPSSSNYNNPCLLVPKKRAGEWRFVTDFRALNRKIIPDKYPLPRFEDIFDGMGKSEPTDKSPRFYSTIDLIKGYYQIPLEEKSCRITAFNVGFGFYEYTRLPFGISVAPNGFSRMIAEAFQDVLGKEASLKENQ